MANIKYVYPVLPGRYDVALFRLSGSGLANCLFVYARAVAVARRLNVRMISPTWLNISIGPYLRGQSDKRHYYGLFRTDGEIHGFSKIKSLLFERSKMEFVRGLDGYFLPILEDAEYISNYIEQHISKRVLINIYNYDFTNCVAVHVRLGDYPENVRVPLCWYKSKILELLLKNHKYKFCLFSDGTDEELKELIDLPNVKRVFFGNALADIFAISKCCYMIGSDSTFSGWGAFIGQVPCVFYRKHFGRVLIDKSKEIVENEENKWL